MGRDLRPLIDDAIRAKATLNVFYVVIDVLEGCTLPGGSPEATRTAQSIIKQCKEAALVQLEKYDAAVLKINATQGKSS